jgi:predicted secreted protein
MSLIGSIVVFVNLWMIILFMVLPWGVRNQLEDNKFQKGTDPGAPIKSKMRKKVLITTLITTIVFTILFLLTKFDIISLRKII